MRHFRDICKDHGTVLKQCRCIGPKEDREVPCPGISCKGYQRPATEHPHDFNINNPCGQTESPEECACGCTAYEERCAYYLFVYSFTEDQVRPEHRCCQIPGRERMSDLPSDHPDDTMTGQMKGQA